MIDGRTRRHLRGVVADIEEVAAVLGPLHLPADLEFDQDLGKPKIAGVIAEAVQAAGLVM